MELDYSPELPVGLLADLERACARHGVPLGKLELLGQDPVSAQLFVESAHAGQADVFLAATDWDLLEAMHDTRRDAVRDLVARLTADDRRPTRLTG